VSVLDLRALLTTLNEHEVRFVVIGGVAGPEGLASSREALTAQQSGEARRTRSSITRHRGFTLVTRSEHRASEHRRVPEVSRFYGIVIRMFWNDHEPPHFHAEYGEYQALIEIGTGAVRRGCVPKRALRLVQEWQVIHEAELLANWHRARSGSPIARIDPLP
jgi:hypothetical protein